jgi:restriction system protein
MFWWLLLPLAVLLGYLAGSYRAHLLQSQGEALVRQVLVDQLPTDSWHLLNNVTLPVADGTTQIDHILVSRYGIFVIETKHYKGWIFGDSSSRQWTQAIYKSKHRFQNPLHQNYKHTIAVQQLLDFLPPEHITGLVVFTGEAEFKSTRPVGVFALDALLAHLKGHDLQVMSENRMQFCIGRLEWKRLALTRETDMEHRANLAARHRNAS